MKVLDILNSAWAIAPQMLRDMQNAYFQHLLREKLDFSALAADREAAKKDPYIVDRGVAIIPISGVLTPGNSLFSYFFGGTSYRDIQVAHNQAEADPKVEQKLQVVDSPGGTVKLGFETADLIRSGKKPTYTFSDGQMTSGAMLIAGPSKQIKITGKTNAVGSIGVIATHVDFSAADKAMGVKLTEIVSGKYKNIFSDRRPLSDEAKAAMQDEVNYLFSLFANDFSKDRSLDVQTVVDWQAKIFIGRQAIDAGLVDGVSTLSDYVNQLSQKTITSYPSVGAQAESKKIKEVELMADLTLKEIQEKHPDLYQSIVAIGRNENKVAVETAGKKGIEDERTRVALIIAHALPGQEELRDKCIAEGISAGDAAMRFLAAENALLDQKAQALKDEKPAKVSVDIPPEKKPELKDDDLPLEAKAKKDWESKKELHDDFLDFEDYLAYQKGVESGQVKLRLAK